LEYVGAGIIKAFRLGIPKVRHLELFISMRNMYPARPWNIISNDLVAA
jgi:hypothetical protein